MCCEKGRIVMQVELMLGKELATPSEAGLDIVLITV